MPLAKQFIKCLLFPLAITLLSSGIARGQIEADIIVAGNDRLSISFSGNFIGPLPDDASVISIFLSPRNENCSPPLDGFGLWLAPTFGGNIIGVMEEFQDGYLFNLDQLGRQFTNSVDFSVGGTLEATVDFDLFHDSFFFETRHCLEPDMTFDVFWGVGVSGGQATFQSSGVTIATAPESHNLGDVNQDGVVSFLDIAPFIVILSSGEFQQEADVDQNDEVNFLDISPFIGILSLS